MLDRRRGRGHLAHGEVGRVDGIRRVALARRVRRDGARDGEARGDAERIGEAAAARRARERADDERLREEGMITTDGKLWTVLDLAGLQKAANFNSNYLHLDRARDDLAAVGLEKAGQRGDQR